MIYTNWEDLYREYNKERSDMSFDEEVSFVEDCFDSYEHWGFAQTFKTPYEDKAKYNGMKFTVDKRLSYTEDDVDLEVLPMWKIKMENGDVIDAYPEEICLAERELVITDVDFVYTGGGIFLFWGTLDNGQYFIADGDRFDVRILNVNPNDYGTDDEIWYAEWQEEHLVRDLNTETEGPAFILKMFDWIHKNKENDLMDGMDYIEEEAASLRGKRGWR